MNTTTIGVFSSHADALEAIKTFKMFKVPDSDISYIYSDNKGKLIDAQNTPKVGEGVAVGITAGATLGALAGLAVANGILPGIGTLFVAGPLATALGFTGATTVAGAGVGAVTGGLLGALVNLGINTEDAALYEAFVKQGDVLVVLRSNSLSVKDVFIKAGATEVREYPYPLNL